jgi:hypothetical protein
MALPWGFNFVQHFNVRDLGYFLNSVLLMLQSSFSHSHRDSNLSSVWVNLFWSALAIIIEKEASTWAVSPWPRTWVVLLIEQFVVCLAEFYVKSSSSWSLVKWLIGWCLSCLYVVHLEAAQEGKRISRNPGKLQGIQWITGRQ